MKMKIQTTNLFEKQLKDIKKQGKKKELSSLELVLKVLENNGVLDAKYKDHQLHANKFIPENSRGLHLGFDLVLVYRKTKDTLELLQIGNHHTLKGFKEALKSSEEPLEFNKDPKKDLGAFANFNGSYESLVNTRRAVDKINERYSINLVMWKDIEANELVIRDIEDIYDESYYRRLQDNSTVLLESSSITSDAIYDLLEESIKKDLGESYELEWIDGRNLGVRKNPYKSIVEGKSNGSFGKKEAAKYQKELQQFLYNLSVPRYYDINSVPVDDNNKEFILTGSIDDGDAYYDHEEFDTLVKEFFKDKGVEVTIYEPSEFKEEMDDTGIYSSIHVIQKGNSPELDTLDNIETNFIDKAGE